MASSSKFDFQRIATQLYAIERASRSMRSELETIARLTGMHTAKGVLIGSGFSRLLSSDATRELSSSAPYVPFAEGVWVGMDERSPNSFINVAVASGIARLDADKALKHSSLTVHPVFATDEELGWCTVESQFDTPALNENVNYLSFEFATRFLQGLNNQFSAAQNFRLNLRIDDGTVHADIFERAFPITTMPQTFSFSVDAGILRSHKVDQATKCSIIIQLPISGNFGFQLDHFEIRAL